MFLKPREEFNEHIADSFYEEYQQEQKKQQKKHDDEKLRVELQKQNSEVNSLDPVNVFVVIVFIILLAMAGIGVF
jgi:hypothetical protein